MPRDVLSWVGVGALAVLVLIIFMVATRVIIGSMKMDPRAGESAENLEFLQFTGDLPAGTHFDDDGYLVADGSPTDAK